MQRLVINPTTGEILTTIFDGDRILRSESVDSFSDFERIPAGETFTKLYHSIIPVILECELSASSLIIFMHLAVNLRYRSNVAKYRNGKLITRQNLHGDLNIPEVTVKRSICQLIQAGLIIEARTTEGKVFVVNPYVVMVGDKVSKTVFDLFRKSKWARW